MPPIVHDFDWPDRFVVGTVGQPGERTFYLQARAGSRVVSVAIEKQQSAVLADKVDEILDELLETDGNPFNIPRQAAVELLDRDPLDVPVIEEFRAGGMGLGWDPSTAQVVIEVLAILSAEQVEALEAGADDLDGLASIEPDEIFIVRIPVGTARAFTHRAREVVAAGRPICPLCEEPMDSVDDHRCDFSNGFP